MTENEIKKHLLKLIEEVIDEQSLIPGEGFVEMEDGVIHCALEDGDYYFKVTLTRVQRAE